MTPTQQFVEIGELHFSAESCSDAEDNLQPQLLDRKLSSSEVDRRIDAMVAPLFTQQETLIQSVRKLSERSSNRSTEGNVASDRSRSSGQHSDGYFHFEWQFLNQISEQIEKMLIFKPKMVLIQSEWTNIRGLRRTPTISLSHVYNCNAKKLLWLGAKKY